MTQTAEIGLTSQCARDHHEDCWLQVSCECECHDDIDGQE
jgi:hypothetical protein